MSSFSSDSENSYSSDDDLWEFENFGSYQTPQRDRKLSESRKLLLCVFSFK